MPFIVLFFLNAGDKIWGRSRTDLTISIKHFNSSIIFQRLWLYVSRRTCSRNSTSLVMLDIFSTISRGLYPQLGLLQTLSRFRSGSKSTQIPLKPPLPFSPQTFQNYLSEACFLIHAVIYQRMRQPKLSSLPSGNKSNERENCFVCEFLYD